MNLPIKYKLEESLIILQSILLRYSGAFVKHTALEFKSNLFVSLLEINF